MVEEHLICAYSGLPSLASFMITQEQQKHVLKPAEKSPLTEVDRDRIIQMAWEDRTPFEAIEFQFGLKEKEVIEFMRKNSLPSSFRMWRKRMQSRKTKHMALRQQTVNRFKCSRQKGTGNKISKR
jgi:uncharacterized protein (TIGR03643 family)